MIRTDTHPLSIFHANQIISAAAELIRTVSEIPVDALKFAYIWQARAAERAQLGQLADHQLRDMGISRAAAYDEYSKPFWRS